jgi:hypothetical protein
LFVIANGSSYFLLSDEFVRPEVQDGIIRLGFPFLFIERGGFAQRDFPSFSAVAFNSLCASIAAVIPLGIGYHMKQQAEIDD